MNSKPLTVNFMTFALNLQYLNHFFMTFRPVECYNNKSSTVQDKLQCLPSCYFLDNTGAFLYVTQFLLVTFSTCMIYYIIYRDK